MTSIELFNELNGKEVSRKYLQQILQQAKAENQTAVIYRISKILNDNPDTQRFEVNIVQYPQGLAGAMHTGDYREALDDCGRLKKGWKFVKGNVVKSSPRPSPKERVKKTEKNAQNVGKGYIPSENIPSEENNKTEAFLQKHKDIPLLEVILSNAQPLYEDSKTNRFGQTTDPELNIIFWKKASKVRPESSEMIIKFKGITKHPLFSKETYREYVLFRFNKKAEAIFDQWQNILEKNKGLSVPEGLYGLECLPYDENQDELQGLGAAVTPEQIYKMITDKIIASMKQATGRDYVKKWKTKTQSFFVPINFETKKPYRGVNFLMLKADLSDGIFGMFENPYFLTFKQVEKCKGKVKKGAKGKEVIYFSYRYSVFVKENGKKKILFKTFDIKQAREFLKEKGLSEESNLERFPILRYYNVFNGADIEGIDFKLPQVEIGKMIPDDSPENKTAELIVKNYPNPPKINHGGDKAYYNPSNDYVQMPPFGDFETANDYYRTLFHELTHSTGHEKRLKRDFSGRFGSKSYAQEELVAEFGAVFLSAFAGFVWHTNKNHAEYLKSWNSVFKIAQDDNKFLMRGASMAQQAADYILNLDEKGEPKFYKDLAKTCKTCEKSRNEIRFKDLDRSEFESYEKNEMVRKKLGLGKEYQGKVYVEKDIVETYLYGAKFHKSKQDIRIGKLDDCQKIELDGRILFISKKKTLDYFTEENAEVRRKVAEEIRKKRREERKVKETENLSDYLDELYQKMLKLDPRAKPLLYQEVAKKFDIHLLYARFFHEQIRIYEKYFKELVLVKGVETELFDKMFAENFDRFFTHRESVFRGKREFVCYYYNDFSKEIGAYILKRQNWKKYGLAAPQLELCTEDLKKMTVKELREFTLQYYLQNLKGKKVAVKDFIKEVVFTTKAGRKIAHGEAMYKEKAVAIEHLEQLIKNSTYNNWGDRKPNDHKEILGYLNFKSKLTIDGEKRHLRIAVILDKDRNFELKSFDIGKKKNSQVPQGALPSAEGTQLFEDKSTKKSSNRKKNDKNFGLGLPLTDEIRKKAFTDKGKLRKGWYYEENGLLTDGKEYYTSDNTLRYYGDKKNKIKTISSKKIEAIDKFISEKANKLSKEKQQFAEKLYEKIAEKFEITTKQTEYLCNGYMYSNHIHSRISLNYLEINDFRKHFGKTINRKFFTQYEKIKTRYADLYDYTFNDFSKQIIQYFIDELKKYDEKFGLGLPLTDEIRQKAFTDKGKLRKGWYYDKYGVLTDGKYLYLPKEKKEYEYEAIQHQIIKDTDNYRYIRYQAEDYQGEARSKNDKIADEQRKTFYEDVAKSLKKDFPNITREDVYDIHNTYVTKDNQRYFTFSAEDLKADSVKEFLKQYALKIGKKYHFNEKAHEVRKRIEAFSQKQTTQLRGDRKAIRRKHGLAAPVPVVETTQEPRPAVFVEYPHPLSPSPKEMGNTQTQQVDDQLGRQTPSPSESCERKRGSGGVRTNSLAQQLANASEQTESYQIDRYDMAQFLGDMEMKNVDSLVITLTGGQGSGKTRFAFQFMNDLAQRYKVGHISCEEHPQSRLYIEKAHQYLNATAMNNIEAHDVRSLSQLDKIIRENEVVVIDSYQKIKEIDSKFEVDKDLRKKYNGKLFLVIFQQTSDGKMRGGSKSQFDGDIILFTEKFPNYQENYVYPDKNRYNSIPANQLKYNIFQQALMPVEPEEQTIENQVYDVIY